MPTRRDFLMQGAMATAAFALPRRSLAAASDVELLEARPASIQLAPDGYLLDVTEN